MQQVPGCQLRYDTIVFPPSPLFHFDIYRSMGGVITIDWYDVAGSGDDIIRMPNFAFKGKESGGLHGACTCGNTGLDPYCIWVCGCSFPC